MDMMKMKARNTIKEVLLVEVNPLHYVDEHDEVVERDGYVVEFLIEEDMVAG